LFDLRLFLFQILFGKDKYKKICYFFFLFFVFFKILFIGKTRVGKIPVVQHMFVPLSNSIHVPEFQGVTFSPNGTLIAAASNRNDFFFFYLKKKKKKKKKKKN
jgi:hypothetical protein